ncbi:hypothetical protein BXZ70DRAFT_907734 [Cristinia sonorae]|uniref:Uncharacterized protein n=1 Tax=Cristinia sonorae TaxID=1940300 RepID=A0A8K0UP32_9AGAR|nr:hypothetical protein BXZ70DRAFT_907734 [Cristinia sonorae]
MWVPAKYDSLLTNPEFCTSAKATGRPSQPLDDERIRCNFVPCAGSMIISTHPTPPTHSLRIRFRGRKDLVPPARPGVGVVDREGNATLRLRPDQIIDKLPRRWGSWRWSLYRPPTQAHSEQRSGIRMLKADFLVGQHFAKDPGSVVERPTLVDAIAIAHQGESTIGDLRRGTGSPASYMRRMRISKGDRRFELGLPLELIMNCFALALDICFLAEASIKYELIQTEHFNEHKLIQYTKKMCLLHNKSVSLAARVIDRDADGCFSGSSGGGYGAAQKVGVVKKPAQK